MQGEPMSSIYEYDNDPHLYHERANKLRSWAAEISSDKIRAELCGLADEYDRHADIELRRRLRRYSPLRTMSAPLAF
jgi:hypothetical protein